MKVTLDDHISSRAAWTGTRTAAERVRAAMARAAARSEVTITGRRRQAQADGGGVPQDPVRHQVELDHGEPDARHGTVCPRASSG